MGLKPSRSRKITAVFGVVETALEAAAQGGTVGEVGERVARADAVEGGLCGAQLADVVARHHQSADGRDRPPDSRC